MSARLLVPAVALLFAASACNDLPKRHGEDVQATRSNALEQSSPIEVALAPVVDSTGTRSAPARDLRSACQAGLVKRRYSPLALELVDRQVVDAAYRPGALDEQAVFTLTVERWDTRLWDTRNVIEVTLAGRMVDPRDASSAYWSGRLEQRFDFSDVQDKYVTASALQRHACDVIVAELLAAMPARQPMPGTSP